MSGPWWLQVILAFISAGLVNKAASIWRNRQNMSTNAVTILQNATSTAVQRTEQDNVRLRVENDRLEADKRAVDHRNDVLLDALRDLLAYSKRQTQVIRQLGGVIEDPPPLPDELLA